MRDMSGFTWIEIITLAAMMIIVVALVLALAPTPEVTVVVKELNVKADETDRIVISPKEITFAPEKMTIAPKKVELVQPEEIVRGDRGEDSDARLRGPASFEAKKTECLNNVRNLIGLLETVNPRRYPSYGGPNLILYLVKKGEIPAKHLGILFCPGDTMESLALAGGADAYADLDLMKKGEYGYLTSYAGRDLLNETYAVDKRTQERVVLLADDSEDHHDAKGFVVGLTGGAAKWRSKKDWGLAETDLVVVGEGSAVKELQCLLED